MGHILRRVSLTGSYYRRFRSSGSYSSQSRRSSGSYSSTGHILRRGSRTRSYYRRFCSSWSSRSSGSTVDPSWIIHRGSSAVDLPWIHRGSSTVDDPRWVTYRGSPTVGHPRWVTHRGSPRWVVGIFAIFSPRPRNNQRSLKTKKKTALFRNTFQKPRPENISWRRLLEARTGSS